MGNLAKEDAEASQTSTSPTKEGGHGAEGEVKEGAEGSGGAEASRARPTKAQGPASGQKPAAPAALTLGLTVDQTLTLPALAGARIVAGHAGRHRVVERVNVMEVPDILPWVKPKELLLTTGYPLRHSPSPLTDLIAELDRAGLSAIAIKPHRYLGDLPADLLRAADALGFPVIELPEGVAFDDILTDVLSDVLDRQAAVLARADRVHRALAQIVLEGGGLAELTAELARILGGPVLVTSPDGRITAEHDAVKVCDLTCFDTDPDPDSGTEDAPTHRLRTETEPLGLTTHHGVQHAVIPIVAGRVDHGRLVAFADQRPFDAADIAALERAATVAARAVVKQLAVAAVEDKYRADFLRDLLTGSLEDPQSAAAYAASLGWDIEPDKQPAPMSQQPASMSQTTQTPRSTPSRTSPKRQSARNLTVLVAELDPGQSVLPASQHALRPARERFAAAWQTVVTARDRSTPVAGFNQEVVVVLKTGDHPDALVRSMIAEVSGTGGGGRRTFSTGVSRPVTAVADLPAAYEEARRAVRMGRRLNGPGSVVHFDALGVYRLLSLIPDPAELRDFARQTLKGLAADGDPEAEDLRTTLEVLLDTNLNVAEAARRLHFHYNTLRYRIGKIERLVGPFMERPDLRLDLSVALRILHMRGL